MRILLGVTLAVVACGDDGPAVCEPDPPIDVATVPLRGPCPQETRLGGFAVSENDGYSTFDGKVLGGVIPITILTEVAADGECRLLRRENPQCNPGCVQEQSCDFDGTCIATPVGQDLGTVRVEGLSACSTKDPVVPGFRYFDNDLPHPAFAHGDDLRLTYGDVTLHGVGVAPFEPLTTSVDVIQGMPVTFAWTPPPAGSRARVFASLNIDQHGITPVTVYCDFPDTGSAEISAAMVDMLFAAGVSGFPNVRLFRHTVDSQEVAGGCVDLSIVSERRVTVAP